MKPIMIAVAGGIGAGKSEFVRALADRMGAAISGFGDFVRDEAAARGISSSRENLQTLGEKLKQDLGDEEFARRVITRAPTTGAIVIDGVRHSEMADAIARVVAPQRFVLIFLDADDELRRARVAARRPDEVGRLAELASHSTERQVHDGSLRERADLVLDARAPVPDLVREAIATLGIDD